MVYDGRSDIWCIDVKTAADQARPWTRLAKSSPWHGRFDHMMQVVGDQLIAYGGENSGAGIGGPYYNDVWSATLEACPSANDVMVVWVYFIYINMCCWEWYFFYKRSP